MADSKLTTPFQTRLTLDNHKKLKVISAMTGDSLQDIANKAIEKHIREYEKKKGAIQV